MTIYISGAISNEPNAKQLFNEAKREMLELYPDSDVINPMQLPHQHDHSWESFMREDIAALTKCEAIYMLRNWKKSRGAKIEFGIAENLKMKIIYQF